MRRWTPQLPIRRPTRVTANGASGTMHSRLRVQTRTAEHGATLIDGPALFPKMRDRKTSDPTRTNELPAPDLASYTEDQLRFAGAAWPMRAAEELRSALIFRALARAAYQIGVAEPWPSHFAAAVRDEVRHARLCASVASRFAAGEPCYDVRPVRARLARTPHPVMRVASLLLVEVAMGETISMVLFRAGRRLAVEPLTRAALGLIVADEVRHQALGWEGIAAVWPKLDDRQRGAMHEEAALGLASCERQTALPALRWLQKGQPFEAALGRLGVLSPEVRVESFYHAVERLVIPRLTHLGVDGALAWNRRYRTSVISTSADS